jgi:hypothetical protein
MGATAHLFTVYFLNGCDCPSVLLWLLLLVFLVGGVVETSVVVVATQQQVHMHMLVAYCSVGQACSCGGVIQCGLLHTMAIRSACHTHAVAVGIVPCQGTC